MRVGAGSSRTGPACWAICAGVWLALASSSRADGPVVGSVSSRTYHAPGCSSAQRLSAKNKQLFPDLATAESRGFVACKTCRPNASLFEKPGDTLLAVNLPPTQAGTALLFSRDIAPVLVGNCLGCHNAQQKRGDYDMSTVAKLMAGGPSGPAITAGKPDESELVLRITGQSTPKMPQGNNRNLAEATIERLQQWVADGAKLDDGLDTNKSLAELAATPEELRRQAMEKLKPEERDQKLDQAAHDRWKKADPDGDPQRVDGEHFVLYGNLPSARAKQALKGLERNYGPLKSLLSRPGKPALDSPEKISVYVFNERNPFTEFMRSVVKREVDDDDQIGGDLKVEAPYLVALDPMGGREESPAAGTRKTGSRKNQQPTGPERGLDALVVEAFGTEAVRATSAEAPRWLAYGVGEYLASQVEPRSGHAQRLQAELVEQLRIGWMTKSQEALGDQGDAIAIRAAGFSLLDFLAANYRAQLSPFVRGMLDGPAKLDEGLQVLFGASRQDFLTSWGQHVSARTGGSAPR